MKTELDQGETLMARVSGNFLEPIFKNNVLLYRGHVRVGFDPQIAKIGQDYYIYAQLLGKNQNNYSLHIKEAQYTTIEGGVSEEDLVKDFSITGQTADFLISPGFIVTEQDFSIDVQNLQDHEITINIKTNGDTVPESNESSTGLFGLLFGGEEEQETETGTLVTLGEGEAKKITFEAIDITEPTFKIIILSTPNLKYEVPVYMTPSEEALEEEQKSFMFSPAILNISMATDSTATRMIYLYNDGKTLLENINLSVSESLEDYVDLSIEQIEDLEENESIKITLTITADSEEGIVDGQIKARENTSFQTYSAVFLTFIKDYQPVGGNITLIDPAILKTCEEMGGSICQDDEECTEETKHARDGNCCLGDCEEVKKDNRGKIIGWIIIIVVVILLLWFFKKTRKKAPVKRRR